MEFANIVNHHWNYLVQSGRNISLSIAVLLSVSGFTLKPMIIECDASAVSRFVNRQHRH